MPGGRDTRAGLQKLEARHGARIGAFAYNLRTKATVRHRAAERFPLCSVFKTLAAAAVLRDLDRHGETLARRIHYTAADLAGYSPKTGEPEHLAGGMTVGELWRAAMPPPNTAANLLLRELGGPTAITRSLARWGTRRPAWTAGSRS